MKLGLQVGLGPGHIVLDRDPAPLPKKETEPPNCGPMFTVAKRLDGSKLVIIGMEVGLIPGHFVSDADPAPLNIRPMFIIAFVISLEHCTGVRRYCFVQVQVQV